MNHLTQESIDNEFMNHEINTILNNISQPDYTSFLEIENNKINIINQIFSRYLNYPDNIHNKELAIKHLEDYEYVPIEQLNKNDFVKYLNIRAFYNIKLINGGKIIEILDDNKILVSKQNKINVLKQKYYFRKINKDTLVKIKLLQLINDN